MFAPIPLVRLCRRLITLTLLSIQLAPLSALACGGILHIEIETAGVYALDHAEIAARQPELADCASDQLTLSNVGKEVPIRVVDAGDGRFSDGDSIEWTGHPLHGPESWFNTYSVNNVYLLSASNGAHARMRDESANNSGAASIMRSLHLEQENMMIRLDQHHQKPGEEPDVWHWAKLTQADPERFKTTFDLPDLASSGRNVAMRINFRGISSIVVPKVNEKNRPTDHLVEVRINGHLLESIGWNGRDESEHALSVPVKDLKAESNELVLSIPKRTLSWIPAQTVVDVVMFNWIEFDYALGGVLAAGSPPLQATDSSMRSIELTWRGEGNAPVLYGDDGMRRPPLPVGGARFRYAGATPGIDLYPVSTPAKPVLLRASGKHDWRAPGQAYDYLIVSHASLMDAVRPLAEFHEKRGMKVALIDIADVYDEFNHGITHPQAVRNLVDTAWHNWPQPRPRFLLLVGDASFDIRSKTYNDLAYAKFANSPQELNPGHFSGIPATAYDAASKSMANRNLIPTWQYPSSEGQSASDNWFGAVDGDDYHPVVAVGRFPVVEPAEVTAIVNKTINYLSSPRPGAWRRDVMFITDESSYFKKASDQIASTISKQGFLADKIYASPDEADNLAHQSAIKDGLNQGQLLVHFIGHGGRYIWRTGPPDLRKNHDLFTLDDVSGLSNSGRLPMVLSMTCYSAPFDNPTEDSIGERFLREADKGAIAVFAASWRNAPSTRFSENLVKELLVPGATIGEGIVRAKKSIDDRTLVEMYNLLGDPAVVLERPQAKAKMQIDGDRWNPSVLIALPDAAFSGQITLNWLDDDGEVLGSQVHQTSQSTFKVPIPRFMGGKIARFVGAYANDPHSGHDAVGGIKLDVEAATRRRGRDWFPSSRAGSGGKPITSDTISRHDFDQTADTQAKQAD